MLPIFLRPGQQVEEYKIYRKNTITDDKGRISYTDIKYPDASVGTLKGSISLTSQHEALYWKQIGHPVTHTIVARGKIDVHAEDVLVRNNEKYYVQGVRDSGDLGIFTGIYCNKPEGVG